MYFTKNSKVVACVVKKRADHSENSFSPLVHIPLNTRKNAGQLPLEAEMRATMDNTQMKRL